MHIYHQLHPPNHRHPFRTVRIYHPHPSISTHQARCTTAINTYLPIHHSTSSTQPPSCADQLRPSDNGTGWLGVTTIISDKLTQLPGQTTNSPPPPTIQESLSTSVLNAPRRFETVYLRKTAINPLPSTTQESPSTPVINTPRAV